MIMFGLFYQGILTEGEGSVWLTSLYRLVQTFHAETTGNFLQNKIPQ
jgi:hypothetical protein